MDTRFTEITSCRLGSHALVLDHPGGSEGEHENPKARIPPTLKFPSTCFAHSMIKRSKKTTIPLPFWTSELVLLHSTTSYCSLSSAMFQVSSKTIVAVLLALGASSSVTTAFTTIPHISFMSSSSSSVVVSRPTCMYESATMADAGVPSPTSEPSPVAEEVDIPTNLPSDCGKDYIPLATMLAAGQLAEADQFTRDALIEISGAKAKGRNFVYFTDVKNIPSTDLATMERLWNKFSGGKFGYTVQKKKWKQSKGDFEVFCRKIGWTTTDGEVERKKRWFGASEFIYDVKKAPEGHLPLTSALRGTSLIKGLLNHPVWDNDDWKKEP